MTGQGAPDPRAKLSALTIGTVVLVATVAPFLVVGGVAAAGNTTGVTLNMAANGAKIPTNHNWSVSVAGGVSADVSSIKLDYTGSGAEFESTPASDLQVLVDGVPTGTVLGGTTEDSGESLRVVVDSNDKPSLSGGETVTVKMIGHHLANPPTSGSYSASIELVDGGSTFATDSKSFSIASGTLDGTVTNASDNTETLSGATVKVENDNGLVTQTTTDASGDYSIEVGPGTYDVVVSATDYATKTRSGVSVTDGGTTTTDVALTPASSITGTVTDQSGSGLSSMTVIAYDQDAGSTAAQTQTDAAGSFTLSVGAGTYDVIAFDNSGTYEDSFNVGVEVATGETVTADVTMSETPPEGTISGTVTDPNGNVVSGATVEAVDGSYTIFKSTSTDANGQYSLSVPEGTYDVTVRPSSYPTDVQTGVYVSASTTTSASFELMQPAHVEGTVTKSGGGALQGAVVVADNGDGQQFTTTDSNGDYSMDIEPNRSTRVTVYSPGRTTSPASVSPAAGGTATADFTMKTTSITHSSLEVVNSAGVDTDKIGLSTQVGRGMLMVRLTNESANNPGMPNELKGLGVDENTEFRINVTVTNYDPTTLLWGARDVTWSTEQNASIPSATDISIKTKAVDLQGINGGGTTIGPLMTKSPSQVQWPAGRNDRADLGWNKTVYFGVFDMATAPQSLKQNFGGMTVTTNAQTFAPPKIVNGTLKVWVAGPHRTVDGTTHSGFYEATIPDAQLTEWGVDPANAKEELEVLYQGNDHTFDVTDLDDGVRIKLDIHYSAGSVEVAPDPNAGGSEPVVSVSNDDVEPTPTPTTTATPTPEPTSTPEPTATPTPATTSTPAGTSTPTATTTPAASTTAAPTPTETPSATATTPGAEGPGFGIVATLAALLALVALRGRRQS
jgi:PGF-CTERM protein